MSQKIKPMSLDDLPDDTPRDPLRNFFGAIKSRETRTSYTKTLREFLNLVEQFQGDFEQKAIQFAEYAQNNPKQTRQLLKEYANRLRERTEHLPTDSNYLNPSVVPNKFKGIRKFLQANEIPMEWKSITQMFPEENNVIHTRGYTDDEMHGIYQYCEDASSQFLVLAESSSGIRVGSFDSFSWVPCF